MLKEKVKAFLKQKGLDLHHKRILIGVSGGPDSLALLHFLWSIRKEYQFYLAAAHVDHMFRGEESYLEAKFVQHFCEEREIPFEMERINVPDYIRATGKSSQLASRECRYSFFEKVISKQKLDYLALGHHGDDQVETILMRLTRGSTGEARAGIPFSRPFGNAVIFRPFLCINRQQIEDYCIEQGLEPRRDPSNEKGIYVRNRFRKEVMPFLRKENPHVHEHFQRFSEEIQSDEAFLQELSVQKLNTVMKKKSKGEIHINIPDFLKMPFPLQRRCIQLILNYLYENKPASLSALHIENAISLMSSPHPSGELNFPDGLKMVRSYEQCQFQFHHQSVSSYCCKMEEPGEIKLPDGSIISLEFTKSPNGTYQSNTLLLNRVDVSLPLVIRTRKDGDRMTLKGMNGTKKIKDIFIDQKVPAHDRMTWPIITDADGNILWLPGLKKSHYSIDKSKSDFVKLTFTKMEKL